MIDEDDIQKAEKNIPTYLSEGLLSKDAGYPRFISFFQDNAKMSFQLANFLFKLSTDNHSKKQNGFPEDYECLIWVVERTHSWFNRFRGILIRWSKKPEDYLAMLHLACGIITWRSTGLMG